MRDLKTFLFAFILFVMNSGYSLSAMESDIKSENGINDSALLEINEPYSITNEDCCDLVDSKPTELTLMFAGGGCAADNNSQGSKSSCTGGVPGNGPYNYTAEDKDGKVFQNGTISLGDIFSVSDGGAKLPNPTWIIINNGEEEIEIHTSCSAPLIPNERYGSLELLSVMFENGEECGEPCPDPGIVYNGSQCIEEPANFQLSNPEFGVVYTWQFGQGSSPSTYTGIIPPPIYYSTTGVKTVSVLQDGACEINVIVNVGECECPDPVIEFEQVCAGVSTTFSTPDLGPEFTYDWNFGAGATPQSASGIGPHVVTYSYAGSATVSISLEKNCEEEVIPQDCCDSFGGKPKSITFKYVGGGCSASNNTQDSGKAGCSGNANNASPTNIKIYDGGTIFFNGTVSLGEEFTASATDKFPSNVDYSINNQEIGYFHASCSQPLGIGDQFGSLLVVGMVSDDGEVCGQGGSGGGSGSDCCDDVSGKPTELTFVFQGGGCAADNNSQGSKSSCHGGVSGSGPFNWTAADGSNVFQSGTISLGQSFTIIDGGAKLPNPTTIRINNGQEEIEIHTSCSAPIVMGERYGSLELVGMVTENNETCEPYIPPVECFPCTAYKEVDIEVEIPYECPPDEDLYCYYDLVNVTSEPTLYCGGTSEYVDEVIAYICDDIQTIKRTWTITVPCDIPEEPENPPVIPTGDCCDDFSGKPTKITFRYVGGGCAASNNSQSGDKWDCNGNSNNVSPSNIQVTDKDNNTLFSGSVSLNQDFVAYNNGVRFQSNTYYTINGGTETGTIHTSCSAPLAVGDQFGSLLIVQIEFEDGGVCGGSGGSGGTPTGEYASSWSVDGGHFDQNGLLELFDGNTTNGDRLHQESTITGFFVSPNTSSDKIQVHWSNEEQDSDQSDKWIGIDVFVSSNGGATTTVFSSSFDPLPVVGDQVFEITPGIPFDYIQIMSRQGEDDGKDPIISEVMINGKIISANGGGGSGGGAGSDCCDSVSGKPTYLTFSFEGGGCAADNNSQGDKSDCNGGATGNGPFNWTAADGNNVFQSGSVAMGQSFTISDGGAKLPNPTTISINGGQEVIEIHTSCSAPMVMGDRYGSLMLTDMVTENNETCSYSPPPPPPPPPGECEVVFECIQYINIDSDPPTIVCPPDQTVECYEDITDGVPSVTTSCGSIYTITTTGPTLVNGQDDCPGAKYEIVYTVTDECERTASCTQSFTIENDPPMIVCPPDQTVECYDDIFEGVPTVTTSCYLGYDVSISGPTLVFGQDFCHGAVYQIVYTAIDDCGRTSSCTQTFTLDNDPPTIVCPPDMTIECVDDMVEGIPTVTTSCELGYTVYVAIPDLYGPTINCPDNEYYILYTVEDECGRTASCEQKFTIENDPPTIVCPPDQTVECFEDIFIGVPTVTTSCDLDYTVTTVGPYLIDGQEYCDGAIYEVEYTVTDVCGRYASCTQRFTLENYGPSIVCPPDQTVECYEDILIGTPIVSVACYIGYTITTVGPTLVHGQDDCPGAEYEIVYTVTDDCGRYASCTQTFTIENDPPMIVCPHDETVECFEDIHVGVPTVTTSCYLGYTVTTVGPTLVHGQDDCPGAIYEIVYTVTDDCGRHASCTQKFTIHNDPPTIVCPHDETVECFEDIHEGVPTVTTSCYLGYVVTTTGPTLVYGQADCPGAKYEIVYTVTDDCGRQASCTQTFTIHNDPPTIVCPPDQIVECYDDIFIGVPTVTTSCYLGYVVTTTGPTLVHGQEYCHGARYEIVYTVTDDCGRQAHCTQVFTLENEGPTIVCPPDKTIECVYEMVEGIPTVTTSCDLGYQVFVAMPSLFGPQINCPGNEYYITYTVEDECGRTATCQQKFTIDNDPPTIVCPPDMTVECYEDIHVGVPTVHTSCDLGYVVTTTGPTLVHGQHNCHGALYELVYTVTDVCGRTAHCTQRFTLENEGPTIVCPHDQTVECYEDIFVGIPTIHTSCDLGYDMTTTGPTLVYGQHNCYGAIYEIIYTVIDECGRQAYCTQKFTIDNHGPTIVCPHDQTVECFEDIEVGVPTVTTSCDLGYVVTTAGPTLVHGQHNCYDAVYEIVYTVTDDCGRYTSCTQRFTIYNEGPTIICPPDEIVECFYDIEVGTPTVYTSCGLTYNLAVVGPALVIGQENCPGMVYYITYSVTDECGRTASCQQKFTIQNNGPTIVCPPDEVVECYDDIYIGIPSIHTSCDMPYDLTTSGPTLVFGQHNCHGAIYEIVYTVTDECGRQAHCTQRFTIFNNPPTIVCPPDRVVECYDDIFVGIPIINTSCELGYVLTTTGPTLVFGQHNCHGAVYEIVYTVTDECGRQAHCTQKFTIDNNGPTIVCPTDRVVECYDDIFVGVPLINTSCELGYVLTTTGPHLVFGQHACHGAIYEIVYTVTDECGRQAHCTQKFTLNNNPPTIVCPHDEVVECYDDIFVGIPTVHTSCDLGYVVTTNGPNLVFGQHNCHGAVYEIVYTVTDDCGRQAHCTQKFTISNNGPTIVCPPDRVVECYDDIFVGIPTVHTSCDLGYVVTTNGPNLVFGQHNCHGAVYEIVYTVTDDCGRQAHCTQKFTISNNGPTIVCPPDRVVECYDDIFVGIPTVHTSCDLGYVVTTNGPNLVFGQHNCFGARYEIVYTVTDDCGRQAHCTQTFTIDNNGPTIVCPHDQIVECYSDIQVGTPTVHTSCGLTYTVTTSGPNLVFGEGDCPGARYEIVYTVTDECGRQAHCTQSFTIENNGPTIVCPPNAVVECYDDIHIGIPIVNTSCDLGYVVTTSGPNLVFGQHNCHGARYEVIYTVTDDCGRQAHCTQVFTIDNNGPTIVCPPNRVVECYDDILVGIPTVHTSCELGYVVTTSGPNLVFGQHNCHGARYEMIYTVTDDCGRQAHCTQVFTIDNNGPTIVCPPNRVVECYDDIFVGIPTVYTSCELGYVLTTSGPNLVFGQDNCHGSRYEIVYTVTDDCGRQAHCTQVFTIDNNGPSIVCPPDRVVECYDDILVGVPTVHTSCDLGYVVTTSGPNLVFGQHNCDGARYEIVYTATDDCGRQAHCTQTFTLRNFGPTIICPPDRTIECVSDIKEEIPTVTTYCGVDYQVFVALPSIVGIDANCPGKEYYILYSVTDECGRTASCQQKFTISNTGPTIVCPADQVVECYDDITIGIPTVNTSCNLSYTVTTTGPNLVFGHHNCDGAIYEVIYTVTDVCGRQAHCTQNFTLDNHGPTIVCPADQVVECYDDIELGNPIVNVSCGLTYDLVSVGPYLVQGESNCDGSIYEIIYTVTDECGRSVSCTQRFTIDNQGPSIICPPNQVVECFDDIVVGVPTVFTSCGLTYNVSHVGPYLVFGQHNCHGAIYEIVYTVTDFCGRQAHCTQTITIDNNGPTIVCPFDQVVECYDDIRPGNPTVHTSCGLGYVVTTSGPNLVFGTDNCPGARYELIYTVTDDCGRQAHCTQTFTIDNIGPAIVCPPDRIVECARDIDPDTPVVYTSCNLGYVVTTSGPNLVLGTDNCPGARYELIYTVTDNCGRQAHCTQVFTIDNNGPTIVCPPDQFVECYDDILIGVPSVNTSCNLGYVVTTSGPNLVFGQHNCHGARYEVVYTATDNCGRQVHCTQTFTIDNNGPTIVCPPDQVVECYDDIFVGVASVTSSCGLAYAVTTSGPHLISGTPYCHGAVYEIIYTATDDCGRIATCSQKFTIDNNGPTISCPANTVVECYSHIVAGTPSVTTSCGINYTTTIDGPILISGQHNCYGAIYQIIYTVIDECGRTASCTQVWSIDNEGPTISCPLDVNVGRIEEFVPGIPVYNTSCGMNGIVTGSGPVLISGHDCDNGVYEYTYTVTDECGRSASCTQRIYINPSDLSCQTTAAPTYCGQANGSATVNAFGGYAPYSYLWNNGSTSSSIVGLTAGTYTVTVTDDMGCVTVCTAYVAPSTNPVCSVTGVDASCEEANGSASVTTMFGVAPYTYAWSNGASTSVITGLASGTYTVTVTDSEQCSTTCSVFIDDTVPPSCYATGTNTTCMDNNGTATVFGIGGSGVYTYLWNTGETTQTITNLTPGTYTAVVTDSNGCSTSCYFTVKDSEAPRCSITSTDTSCGMNTGSASVFAVGGVPPYSYYWNTGETSTSINNLASGTYTVVITDFAGCQTSCSVTIGHSSSPTCSITASNTTCGLNNGSAVANVSGGAGNYTYLWSTGSTNNAIFNLSPGNYSVTVTDGEGCVTTCSAFVEGSQPISCTISSTDTSCDFDNGTATVQVNGGSGSYTYAWSNGSAAQSQTGLGAGIYSVDVIDNITGCTTSCSVTVGSSSPLYCTIDGVNTSCGLANGTATVNVFNGSGSYSYQWNFAFPDTPFLTQLAPGTYVVNVVDLQTGCQTTCSVIIEGSAPLICEATSTSTSCGSSNGSASVNVIGGSGNYSYAWSNGSTSQTIIGLAAGFYTVNVVDNNTGCTSSCSVTITDSNPISCSIIGVPTTCGYPNGSATVQVIGGSGSYSYSWSNGSTSQSVTGLPAGTYQVDVTDVQTGCVTSCSVIILGSNPISCSIDGNDPSCGDQNGSATVQVSGGSGSYSYSWSNGANTQTVNGLAAGSYLVTVVDSQTGCEANCSVTLQASANLSCFVTGVDPSCGLNNGSATVTISGGTGSYSIAWSVGGTLPTITGLTAGTYSVTVTDNITSCITSCFVTLQPSTALSCSITSVPSTCGENNASATAFVSGGSGNYSYSWSNGATTQSIQDLGPGVYSVFITDNATGCTTSCTVDITPSSPISCAISSNNCSCGLHNGSASVNVSGGSGNFTYMWSHGATTASVIDLAPGVYTVTVTDLNGSCTTTCTTTIGGSNAIQCSTSTTDTQCGVMDGSATVHVSGGSGNYNYSWSNGGSTATITGLSAGSYTVLVTDLETGCITSCIAIVNGSTPINCSISSSNASCGLDNGTASVQVTGGSGSYTYSWSNGSSSANLTGLAGGTYFVTVVDNITGCSTNCSVLILENGSPSCIITNQNATCGQATGSATVIATGGSGIYTYLWSNGATTATISNVPSGTYAVTVLDQGGCTTICSTVIALEPSPSCQATSTDATCGQNNGTATVTASGGIPGYTYLWSNGATSSSINGLSAGNYSVTVYDSNGCTSVCQVTVGGSGNFACNVITSSTNCGQSNGSALVQVSGGSAPYVYLWSNGANSQSIANLSQGVYSVTVIDATGCTTVCSGTVSMSGGGPACSVTGTNASCGDSNGTATAHASGGLAPYSYLWSNGATTASVSNLVAATYHVTITDANGCSSVCSINIESIGGPTCTITVYDASCGSSNGALTASAFGGSGLYSFQWSNGGSSPTISGLSAGFYSVTITDQKGCTTVCTAEVGNDGSNCNAEIGDFVWEDLDADGIQDINEPGIPDVQVTLWNAVSGSIVSIMTTDQFGYYCFTGLAEGSYYVQYGSLPASYVDYVASPKVLQLAQQDVNCDITGANGPMTTNTFYLAMGDKNKSIDAGFYKGASIGNHVWCDNPENGMPNLYDSYDTPIVGAIVSLYRFDILTGVETLVGSMLTDINGHYGFNGLPAGNYIIEVDVTTIGKVFVSANAQDFNGNQPDDLDSDIIYRILEEQDSDGNTRSVGRTNLISLSTGEVNNTIDCGVGEGTVPIELYDFVGRWNDTRELTELEWVTDVELKSSYFGIERTRDLSEEFTEIGRKQAAGYSVTTSYYDYEDDTVFESGTYYYRLRMVDLDGSYSYSKIVVVEVEMDNSRDQEIGISVYPNPVIDEITVEMTVERRSEIEGGIFNAIGQLIKDFDINSLDPGRTSYKLDVKDLPVGTYLLRVKIDNDVIFEKITKTE